MEFEWDEKKAAANLLKHGIDFADAVIVFHDDFGLTVEDRECGEERFATMGVDALGRILVVIWTVRAEKTRIISARKATPRERRHYQGEPR